MHILRESACLQDMLDIGHRGHAFKCAVPAQGITIADPNLPDCPLMYVNEAFCSMTGYTREEIIGRNCRFLQGPDTDPASIARIRTAIKEVHHQKPVKVLQTYLFLLRR